MPEFLLFLEAAQAWIYLLLGIVIALYGRIFFQAVGNFRAAIYGLERQRANQQLMRSGAVLAMLAAALLTLFILTTFAAPAIPPGMRPTPIPTVSLLATPIGDNLDGEGFATATPFTVDLVDGSGCANVNATLVEPISGDSVQGQVSFLGAANIVSFAFYKLEYHDLQQDSNWLAISASNITVCEQGCAEEELLGTWDTSLVRPGQYAVQLVVTDTSGNAPLPCQILLQVLP